MKRDHTSSCLLTFTIGVGLSLPIRALKANRIEPQLKREVVYGPILIEMRNVIDQCRAELPISLQTLRQLVDVGCLREIPLDPITGKENGKRSLQI